MDTNEKIYSISVPLTALECDRYQRLRMSQLLKIMQKMTVLHTTRMGFGQEKTLARGILWVIARSRIELVRPPQYGETIRIETWQEEMQHIIFPRHFRVYDGAGRVIIRAVTLWMLIDAKKRSYIFPAQYGILIPGIRREGELDMPGDIPVFSADSLCGREVRYSDLDLNGHVNNTHYCEWLDDLFDDEYHRTHYWSQLQLNYMKEVPAHSQVEIGLKRDGDVCLVQGKVKGLDETAFRIRGVGREIVH